MSKINITCIKDVFQMGVGIVFSNRTVYAATESPPGTLTATGDTHASFVVLGGMARIKKKWFDEHFTFTMPGQKAQAPDDEDAYDRAMGIL